MPRKSFTAEQIIAKLRQIEVLISQGYPVAGGCRATGFLEQSYYRWRKEYGGMGVTQAKQLKALVAGVVLAVLSLGTRAETRGLVVPAPDTGETVVEYKGSYALLIGSADYQNVAWPTRCQPLQLIRVARMWVFVHTHPRSKAQDQILRYSMLCATT
ncbi:MAG: transposase [Arenicellales bacterium]|jgi:hypothetical protein|nr:transposase [Arenicellales bacterium]MDP6854960.1 transposase [Arenicellales bacterium]|tara:strand:+ start:1447 stop:1917 length:471 start_codon:yes stop_codon:yes gene_type:complete